MTARIPAGGAVGRPWCTRSQVRLRLPHHHLLQQQLRRQRARAKERQHQQQLRHQRAPAKERRRLHHQQHHQQHMCHPQSRAEVKVKSSSTSLRRIPPQRHLRLRSRQLACAFSISTELLQANNNELTSVPTTRFFGTWTTTPTKVVKSHYLIWRDRASTRAFATSAISESLRRELVVAQHPRGTPTSCRRSCVVPFKTPFKRNIQRPSLGPSAETKPAISWT
mmetsp:Transcript_76946/g.160100  ORF Transcript_76946/g.160100 Transcript_76946/m.160100 type:complete len:223 (+) Transcript_76946:435-1103(+)